MVAKVKKVALGAGNIGIYFITGIIVLVVGEIILASNAMRRPEEKSSESTNDSS